MLLDDGQLNCCNLMEGRYFGQYERGQFVVFCVADFQEETAEICIDGLVRWNERRVVNDVLGDVDPS